MHTTNYFNTLIEIAEDSPVDFGQIPLTKKGTKTIAEMQYGLIVNNPYKYTSDDVLLKVFAERNGTIESQESREGFFSKGQPCLRASPLTKRYGFGVHSDLSGKVALFGAETEEYKTFLSNPEIKKVKAMRTTKK